MVLAGGPHISSHVYVLTVASTLFFVYQTTLDGIPNEFKLIIHIYTYIISV